MHLPTDSAMLSTASKGSAMRLLTSVPAFAVLWFAGCGSAPSTSASHGSLSSQDPVASSKPAAEQPTFGSPEEAVSALYRASAAKDLEAMTRIIGLPAQDVTSGDPEQ